MDPQSPRSNDPANPSPPTAAAASGPLTVTINVPEAASVQQLEIHTRISVERGQTPPRFRAQPPRSRLLSSFDILSPNVDALVDVGPKGIVHVVVDRIDTSAGTFAAYVKVLPASVANPTLDPSEYNAWNVVLLGPFGAAAQLAADVFVDNATLAQPAAGNANNQVVIWPVINGQIQPNDFVSHPIRAYVGAPATPALFVVPVNAKNSIWFAWAPRNFSAPAFNDTGDVFRPYPLIVPQDAARVSFDSSDGASWTHINTQAGRTSNADGRTTDPNDSDHLLVAAYRSAALNSQGIGDLTSVFPLNRLVGVWQPPGVTAQPPDYTTATPEVSIGRSNTLTIKTFGQGTPVKAKRLFLGMHDGQQWDDNEGTINVNVTWLNP